MSFKIDLNSKINIQMEGPSSSYHQTKNRFNAILTEKLGVKPKQPIAQQEALRATDLGEMASNVKSHSGVSAEWLNSKLAGTQMAGLGEAFVKAEAEHGVNAIFLTGLAIHESAYGSSKIAQDKNNLFGYQAYDASPYASARTFKSFEEGIDFVAGYLSRAYLSEGGTFFNGYGVADIGKRYATDPGWSNAIVSHMNRLLGA